MTYNLSIHKPCSSYTGFDEVHSRFIRLENLEEFNQVHELCKNDKNMAGFWKATVMPIRTDCASLSQDLFLPTLIHGVIKTNNASSTCLIFVALFWDLTTLPLRLITLLPRVYHNAAVASSEHPLLPYLRGKGLIPLDMEGKVHIRVYTEEHRRGRIIQEGRLYMLHLTHREVPFAFQKSSGDFGYDGLETT